MMNSTDKYKVTYLEKVTSNYWKKKSTIIHCSRKKNALDWVRLKFNSMMNINPVKIEDIEYV